ncbi:MAG TPA: replication-relaxation family protein [Roseiflexaceae bacterium]|nr:replication-relaxation family protein [Roseiflexaceae bacterium]
MTRDNFGMRIPSALPPTDRQEVELLRALGRLELLTVEQIRAAFFPTMSLKGVHNRLERLLADEVVWRTEVRFTDITGFKGRPSPMPPAQRSRLKHPFAYGLSDAGKILLDTLEVERDEATFQRLRSRDPRGRKPDTRTFAHDLQVSWWCLNVLMEAAHNRFCRSVYAQVEFISEARQRIDALVILRLSPSRPRAPEEIGFIPWFDGTPRAADEIDIRLALEVDRGTEELRVLLGKGASYRDLTLDGIYTRLLGGPVLPVFLVQTVRRARQIATEFRAIWPQGWGVISTPGTAAHPQAGALWGTYLTLTDSTPFSLLTEIQVAPSGQVSFVPVCDLAVWLSGRVTPQVAISPEQLFGQAGGVAKAAGQGVTRLPSDDS